MRVSGITTAVQSLLLASLSLAFLAVGAVAGPVIPNVPSANIPNGRPFRDSSGFAATYNADGAIRTNNLFFQSIGTNGRSCFTCHRPETGWSITPENVRDRFIESRGTDPIFSPNDGSNSPLDPAAQPSNHNMVTRASAYSMLLNKGVIRVGISIPAAAEFKLAAVDDPYGYAGHNPNGNELSLFRRPLPSANLGFLSTVMWDGRESTALTGTTSLAESVPATPASVSGSFQALVSDLMHQANDAATGHAQAATSLTIEQQQQIAAFELGLSSAQTEDSQAGPLDVLGAKGGPVNLYQLYNGNFDNPLGFYLGINDLFNDAATGLPFNPLVMTLYGEWGRAPGNDVDSGRAAARLAVARGEVLFNTKPINITGVAGLNDAFGIPSFKGSCSTCHDTPNVGNHSVGVPLNVGVADVSQRTPDLPLYTLQNINPASPHFGEMVQTTDPGRAMITGKWADIGKFKGPVLRGLASRAPYFHNGSAASLEDVITFYDTRFGIGFTAQEKSDLAAFLRTL